MLVLSYLLLRPSCRREAETNSSLVTGCVRPRFWVQNGWRVGRNLAMMARSGTAGGEAIVDTAVISGDNSWRSSLEQELHAVMVSFHFGAWEYLPKVFSRRAPVRVVVGRQRANGLDAELTGLRSGSRVSVVRSAAELRNARNFPGITGFMLDNTSRGRRTTVARPGVDVAVPNAAFRVGGPVVPMFAWFESCRLQVRAFPAGDEAAAVDALLEMVRSRPEEWVSWGKAGAVRPGARHEGTKTGLPTGPNITGEMEADA